MRYFVLLLLFLPLWAGPVWAANDHGIASSAGEQNALHADAHNPFIVSGCTPGITAPLTLTAFACDGQVLKGEELVFVRQAASAVTFPAVDGNHYVLLFEDTFTNPAGWAAAGFGTHYRQQQVASQPADPDGGLVVIRAVVAGGVITAVTSIADRAPVEALRNTAFAEDYPSIQAAIDAASDNGTRPGAVFLAANTTYALGTTTLDIPRNVAVEGDGLTSTIITYTGTGTAVRLNGSDYASLEGVAIDIGSSATAIALEFVGDGTVGGPQFNRIENVELRAPTIVAGQQGLVFTMTGGQQATFNDFLIMKFRRIDRPHVSLTGSEANLFSHMLVESFGTGASGCGFEIGSNASQYTNTWFGRGSSTATTLTGFCVTGSRNIIQTFADLGAGTVVDVQTGSNNLIRGVPFTPTTFGTINVPTEEHLGQARGFGGAYLSTVQGITGANRNMFSVGVSGFTNGMNITYNDTGPQAMKYEFLNGPVGIGVSPVTSATPSLTIGANGTPVTEIMTATGSLNFTALAANSCEVLTIPAVTGAVDGDAVFLGVPNALADVDAGVERTDFFAWISAAGVASVRRCNVTGTVTTDPAPAIVRVDVVRH